MENKLCLAGKIRVQHLREGVVIDEEEVSNLTVNEGLNALLGIMLGGASQITTWYLGLFTGNYTVVASDAAATIAGNSTEATGYTAGARQQWNGGSASSQSITNSASQASFTFNAIQTIYGAFLVSSSVINGTSGKMFSGAQFGTAKNVVNNDVLLLTYTFNAASS